MISCAGGEYPGGEYIYKLGPAASTIVRVTVGIPIYRNSRERSCIISLCGYAPPAMSAAASKGTSARKAILSFQKLSDDDLLSYIPDLIAQKSVT